MSANDTIGRWNGNTCVWCDKKREREREKETAQSSENDENDRVAKHEYEMRTEKAVV